MHEWNRKDSDYLINRGYGEIDRRHAKLDLAVRGVSLAIFAVIIIIAIAFQSADEIGKDDKIENIVTAETAQSIENVESIISK